MSKVLNKMELQALAADCQAWAAIAKDPELAIKFRYIAVKLAGLSDQAIVGVDGSRSFDES